MSEVTPLNKRVVAPANLGKTIISNLFSSNKYDVNIDKETLIADLQGVISLNVNSVTVRRLIRSVETATKFEYSPVTRIIRYTNEKGTETIIDLSEFASRIETEESETIVFSGTGENADKLKAEVKISGKAGNAIAVDDEGLYVSPGAVQGAIEVQDAFGTVLGFLVNT